MYDIKFTLLQLISGLNCFLFYLKKKNTKTFDHLRMNDLKAWQIKFLFNYADISNLATR